MNKLWQKIKNHLVPHAGNNFEPHFVRRKALTAIGLALIVLELGLIVQLFVVFDKTKFLAAVLPSVLINQTNDKRTENNLTPLTVNPLLVKAAELKAQDMAQKGYFSHNTPDGKTPWYWLEQVGYSYQYAGENLAVNFTDSKEVTEAWMNSPTHRANIVKENYTEIGIAIANGVYKGRETTFVVQFFGKPAKTLPTIEDILPTANAETKVATIPKTTTKNTSPTVQPKTVETKTEVKTPVNPAPAKKATPNSVLGEDVEQILTSPRSSLRTLYMVIGVAFLLLLATWLRLKQIPVRAVLRSAFLIAVIASLLYINEKILPVHTITPAETGNSVYTQE